MPIYDGRSRWSTPRRGLVSLLLVLLCALPAAAADAFRGNTRSRVFHRAGCQHYGCGYCTKGFSSAAAAIEAGYRPCGTCNPGDSPKQSLKDEQAENYVGNTSSRKFHKAACRHASCKNCTARFKSREEAIEARFVPAGCCNP